MNKILLPLFLSLFSLGFLSCIDESAPVAVATVDSTSAADIFGGYTMELNPTIEFAPDGKSGTYDNSAKNSSFPAGEGIQVVITYQDGGVGLDIIFTADAFTDGALGVTVQDFKDSGNDGAIDEFTVSAAKVGDTPIPGFQPVVQRPTPGEMKRSEADLAANPVAGSADAAAAQQDVDISGAPTVAEWNSNVVGKGILIVGQGGDTDLLSFTSSTAGVLYEISDGFQSNFTYTYEKRDEGRDDEGIIKVTIEEIENGVKMVDYTSVDVDFTDWYNGTYEEAVSTETNTATDVVTNDDSLDKGTFKIESDTSGYVQKNFTASTSSSSDSDAASSTSSNGETTGYPEGYTDQILNSLSQQ
ncbi:MAG: hypothetical protein HN531_04215 [Opitutae bacterium]|jgi:hypothetical protein|nr:hypothetical protein [Opitutae bacterium]